MENLPIELFNSILGWCHVKDVRNLACCNKDYHTLVTPVLWRAVRISLSALSTKLGLVVENLKYTTHLSIREDHSYASVANDELQVTGKELTARRKSVDIGFNLAQLISCCDPTKVVSLNSDLNGVGFERMLERFCHLKSLTFSLNGEVEGRVINNLTHLEELEVSYSLTRMGDDQFWYLIAGEKILKLKIIFCNQFFDRAVEHFGKWTNLEHLTLMNFCTVKERATLDLGPLIGLKNLTFLRLFQLNIRDEDLRQLCRSLKKLKSLDLSHSQFEYDAMSEIDCLESLTHLSLRRCEGITPRCLKYLKTLPLHSISLSADICHSLGEAVLNVGVNRLNKLSTLKKVEVYSERSKSSRNSLAVISNSLCFKETWMTRIEPYGPSSWMSTFTR